MLIYEQTQSQCNTANYLDRRSMKKKRSKATILFALAFTATVVGAYVTFRKDSSSPQENVEKSVSNQVGEEDKSGIVTFSRAKWETAGIRMEPAKRTKLSQIVSVTGQLAINEDRLAQIYSQVEGVVFDVPVHFGQDVIAGQTLVIIDSHQIGLAKLDLIKSRLTARLASEDYQWHQTVETNVQALIKSLQERVPIAQIEQSFIDRDMGDFRAQLISAYARLHKAQADYTRLKELTDQRVAAGKDLMTAQTSLEADQATMQALQEQIKFTSRQNRIASEHELEKAKTAESISEINLRILGVRDTAGLTASIISGGESVSHYTITAPFDGSIIEKDVVLLERVETTAKLLTIADLSTLWVRADIFDQHIPLLDSLQNKTIRFRVNSYPNQAFEGRVFSTGPVVNDKTRTLPMTAIVNNPDRRLKPGMFISVELHGNPTAVVLAVPVRAIQEHENKRFVFVNLEGEQFVRRVVTTGSTADDAIEIIEGIDEGDLVVVDGGFFLKSQMLTEQFADKD